MSLWKTYLQPNTVEHAVEFLHDSSSTVAVIAGGTDLLLDMRNGRQDLVDVLVDISSIEEMRQIRVDEDYIFLGAAVTLTGILDSPLLKVHAACLVEGCRLIGGPQVRNVATIGGNVAHALPAADGTIALLSLNAEAQIASMEGRRWVPLEGIFAGPGKTNFDRSAELLVGFRFAPIGEHEASAFHRVMRPQRVAIAIINMAAWVRCSSNGRLEDIRLAVGAAGPRPLRARKTEAALRNRRLSHETLQLAIDELLSEASFRTSPHRATLEYRRHLVPTVLARVVRTAYNRALDE